MIDPLGQISFWGIKRLMLGNYPRQGTGRKNTDGIIIAWNKMDIGRFDTSDFSWRVPHLKKLQNGVNTVLFRTAPLLDAGYADLDG
jgi:hypothetical protein